MTGSRSIQVGVVGVILYCSEPFRPYGLIFALSNVLMRMFDFFKAHTYILGVLLLGFCYTRWLVKLAVRSKQPR